MKSIERCHVALLVIDATIGVTREDQRIAGHILLNYKSVIVVVNKWDLISKTRQNMGGKKDEVLMSEFAGEVIEKLSFMNYVPVVFTSAIGAKRFDYLLNLPMEIHHQRFQHITSHSLIELVKKVSLAHQPPKKRSRRLKIYYATQTRDTTPTFIFFVNHSTIITQNYQKYLEEIIRERYQYKGTPLKLLFKEERKKRRQSAPRNSKDETEEEQAREQEFAVDLSNENKPEEVLELETQEKTAILESENNKKKREKPNKKEKLSTQKEKKGELEENLEEPIVIPYEPNIEEVTIRVTKRKRSTNSKK